MSVRRLVIGVAGGSGSGKSTLVERLVNSPVRDSISVLPHDHYYHSQHQMPEDLRASGNWDHPEAIDNHLFAAHLQELKNGVDIERPAYCFKTHSRLPERVKILSRPIILVEGILLLAIPVIRELIDWRVYVDAPSDERILRRILRDTTERGRSLQSVIDQYRGSARPMHEAWIEPSRNSAHLVVPNEHEASFAVSCRIIENALENMLKR